MTTTTDIRINPLLEISPDALQALVEHPIARIERVEGGLTNTIHRLVLERGDVLAVKHYAGGREAFDAELVTLTLLHGTLPVPDVIRVDDEQLALVYKWIDGITVNELRKHEPPAAFASLAEPLGRLLAWLARTDATESFALTEVITRTQAQLEHGHARHRLGAPLSDALRTGFDAMTERLAWGAVCLVHGDLGGRNLIVQRADRDRWRINGVIDWEATSTGSPLVDLGSLFRYVDRYDAQFRSDFERGYREADGQLPDGWLLTARLLDATMLIDTLEDPSERPGVYADCRMLLAKIAAELRDLR